MLNVRPKILYGNLLYKENDYMMDLLLYSEDVYINIASISIERSGFIIIRAKRNILEMIQFEDHKYTIFESLVNEGLAYTMIAMHDTLQIPDPFFQEAILFCTEIF